MILTHIANELKLLGKSLNDVATSNLYSSHSWNAVGVDGHDINELCKQFHLAEKCFDRPTCLVAKTLKGKNFAGLSENLKLQI